jgi:hypothetical protein
MMDTKTFEANKNLPIIVGKENCLKSRVEKSQMENAKLFWKPSRCFLVGWLG